MKVGFAQFAPLLGGLEENRRAATRLIEEAAAQEVDLLVLPELCQSGYRFASPAEAEACAEPANDGPFSRLLIRLAARHRLFVVAGLCESDRGRLYNSAILAGPDGIRGLYRKIHLFWDEKDLFAPGDLGLPVFDLAGRDLGRGDWTCRAGILICFDWQFPEAWRVLALKGADLVCHPSNLVLPGLAQRAVPVQAMLNRVWTVLGNRHGRERDLHFTGRSMIISPRGEPLAEAPAEGDALQIVEIDPAAARDKQITPRNHLILDRRPEFYGEITGERTDAGR